MTKVNPLEQAIMEARIDELRRQVHVLERQLLLPNQNDHSPEVLARDASIASDDATPLCIGAG